jgi:predicted Rossmann fold nucleotide-binding protein DprA/Smf involved in DNA uptake
MAAAMSSPTKRQALLGALGTGSTLEQLRLQLGWPCQEISDALLDLELAGLVLAQPGLRWRLR